MKWWMLMDVDGCRWMFSTAKNVALKRFNCIFFLGFNFEAHPSGLSKTTPLSGQGLGPRHAMTNHPRRH
jgi:hypothetical protein